MPVEPQKIGTSSMHWFLRGLAAGVMLVAAGNAISYFFRTPSIADLIGSDTHVTEAVGFPFEIWRENAIYYGSQYVDYPLVGLNLLVGVGLGAVLGLIAVRLSGTFNLWVEEFDHNNSDHKTRSLQFSVKSLLSLTTIAAVLIAVMTRWKGTPEVLMAIYFLGPIALVAIAMIPNRIQWKHRVFILSMTAFAMIGIALWSGVNLGVPADRVLLGIFVSWTPQSAFGALILTVGLVARSLFSKRE